MRRYRIGRLAAVGTAVAAATLVLLVTFGGVAAAASVTPAPTSNGQTRSQFKANCSAANGHYSEGTGKDLATGREYHTITCNSSSGILTCEHAFVTRDCEKRSATRLGKTSPIKLNGPSAVARP
jgi:hypothetical protein